jgi:isopropylmalate/homocitrate/citramalate synthase
MTGISRHPDVRYLALVPNVKGLERARAAGTDAIAIFTSATEAFAQANVGTSIAGTFERFASIAANRDPGTWMRGYISVAFGCPYAGDVSVSDVVSVAERLLLIGCDEVCLADTIGVARPQQVRTLLSSLTGIIPSSLLALHFHDTAGNALENVAAGLESGVRVFDAAAGGLGGCPFAPGAPGNLNTAHLLSRLAQLGLETGVAQRGVDAAVSLLRPYISSLPATAA